MGGVFIGDSGRIINSVVGDFGFLFGLVVVVHTLFGSRVMGLRNRPGDLAWEFGWVVVVMGCFLFLVLFLCLVIVAVVVVGDLSRLILSRLEDTTDATGVGESWDRVSCVSWVSSVSPVY